MNILEELQSYILEDFDLQPQDFEPELGVSFEIYSNNEKIGSVTFKLPDGSFVNITTDKVDYKNIIPVINLDKETQKTYDFTSLKSWIIKEIKDMGYTFNTIIINGSEYQLEYIEFPKSSILFEIDNILKIYK